MYWNALHKAAVLLLLLSSACGGPATYDVSGEGEACLWDPSDTDGYFYVSSTTTTTAPVLEAGPSRIVVIFDSCVSGGEEEGLSCQYDLEDTTIMVSSTGTFTPRRSSEPSCDTLGVSCGGPDLSEGTWTLEYGAGAAEFEFPAVTRPCARNFVPGGSGI